MSRIAIDQSEQLSFSGSSDPTVSNDVTAGFREGMRWLNTSTGYLWVCISSAAGAAVWKEDLSTGLLVEFSTILGVPGGGTRYLDRAGIACTVVPVLLSDKAVLRGISVVVDVVDASRAYAIEVVSDPAGTPVMVGSALSLPTGTRTARRRDLFASISAGTLWGVRIRRTSGAGGSTFMYTRVELELSMP